MDEQQQAEDNRKFVKKHGKYNPKRKEWTWDLSTKEFMEKLKVGARAIRQYKQDVAAGRIIKNRTHASITTGGVNSLLSRIKNNRLNLKKVLTYKKRDFKKSKDELERVLIIPDTHVPYHDRLAFDLMLKAGKDFQPDHVIVMGDFADFYSVSSHDKNPERVSQLNEEINVAIEELQKVIDIGARTNVFIAGNHEFRLEKYLMQKAPALWEMMKIPSVLALDKLGFTYVPYRDHYKLGKVYLTHDTGKAGETAHKQALATYGKSIVIGHTHRMAMMIQGNIDGEVYLGSMLGWLGDKKKIDYNHRANIAKDWVLGFGYGYLNPKTGILYLIPTPIINYSCVVNGKLYES